MLSHRVPVHWSHSLLSGMPVGQQSRPAEHPPVAQATCAGIKQAGGLTVEIITTFYRWNDSVLQQHCCSVQLPRTGALLGPQEVQELLIHPFHATWQGQGVQNAPASGVHRMVGLTL